MGAGHLPLGAAASAALLCKPPPGRRSGWWPPPALTCSAARCLAPPLGGGGGQGVEGMRCGAAVDAAWGSMRALQLCCRPPAAEQPALARPQHPCGNGPSAVSAPRRPGVDAACEGSPDCRRQSWAVDINGKAFQDSTPACWPSLFAPGRQPYATPPLPGGPCGRAQGTGSASSTTESRGRTHAMSRHGCKPDESRPLACLIERGGMTAAPHID